MKRYSNLWVKLIRWDNLVLAAHKAQRGKRHRYPVQRFNFILEKELLRLQQELRDGTYRPGKFTSHWIYEPKRRLISAAPYRDRVVHHALMNVLEPILDRHFHPDSFACRKEKGTHKAANRLQVLMKKYKYVLQCDIQKFFPSIDHNILKTTFRKLIKDKKVLWLMDLIVDFSNQQETVLCWFVGDDLFSPVDRKKGLPIGNLTSQWFANWMLNDLDHYITSHLRIGGYVRYCDDFVLLNNKRNLLKDAIKKIRENLYNKRLLLHERKVFIRPVRAGLSFVGYRIWPTHQLLRKQNVKRFRRRLKWMKTSYAVGLLDWKDVKLRLDSWLGHAKHADTKKLIRRLSKEWKFKRDGTDKASCSSRRQLEQQCQQLPRSKPQQHYARQSQQQHRFPLRSALSSESEYSAQNPAVYGLRERGFESPGSIPELRLVHLTYRSRIYAVRPGVIGRLNLEDYVRPFRVKSGLSA